MPVTHVSKSYGIQAAKIYPITTDATGGATVYGSGIQVVGAKELVLTPEIQAKELRGDNTLLDADSVLTGLKGTVKFAKVSLDVLNVLTGSLITDSGTTPNMKAVWALKSADAGKFFKLDCQAARADPVAGDIHYIFYKCKVEQLPLGLAEEDFKIFTFGFMSMPILGTGLSWLDVAINETAVAPA